MALTIDIRRVRNDGSTYSSGVPRLNRIDTKLPRGADVLIRLTVINNDGSAVDLTNAAITLTARDVAEQALFTPVLAVITDELAGEATIFIPDSYTRELPPSKQ